MIVGRSHQLVGVLHMCKSYEHIQSQDQYNTSGGQNTPGGPEKFQWANPNLFQIFQKTQSFSLLLPMISFDIA